MNPVRTRLSQDHRELAALLERLSQGADVSDREALTATWSELERRLICHMQAEERFLLPLIEASHPAAVEQVLLEHAQIRDRLSELGVAVELHTVRKGDIQSLIELLQAHSKREDEQLYAFAGDRASVSVEHRILAMLEKVVRSALRTAS